MSMRIKISDNYKSILQEQKKQEQEQEKKQQEQKIKKNRSGFQEKNQFEQQLILAFLYAYVKNLDICLIKLYYDFTLSKRVVIDFNGLDRKTMIEEGRFNLINFCNRKLNKNVNYKDRYKLLNDMTLINYFLIKNLEIDEKYFKISKNTLISKCFPFIKIDLKNYLNDVFKINYSDLISKIIKMIKKFHDLSNESIKIGCHNKIFLDNVIIKYLFNIECNDFDNFSAIIIDEDENDIKIVKNDSNGKDKSNIIIIDPDDSDD